MERTAILALFVHILGGLLRPDICQFFNHDICLWKSVEHTTLNSQWMRSSTLLILSCLSSFVMALPCFTLSYCSSQAAPKLRRRYLSRIASLCIDLRTAPAEATVELTKSESASCGSINSHTSLRVLLRSCDINRVTHKW